jgi:hypothetical protein
MRRLMRDAAGRPILLLHASMRWDRFSYRLALRQTRPIAAAADDALPELGEDEPIEELGFAL